METGNTTTTMKGKAQTQHRNKRSELIEPLDDTMSLDVMLHIDDEEVYTANITHNLNEMAEAAGIYKHLWRPEELGITHAKELIDPLQKGLELMRTLPATFEQYNSPNGWGLYKNFVPWIVKYLEACKRYPDAVVSVCR